MASEKKKKKKKWVKWVVIAVIVLVLVIVIRGCSANAAQALYTPETVESRDIQNFHTFTGIVEPVKEEKVCPKIANLKIEDIVVEEGDEVKEGDVIMYLDTESIQDQIDELELSMSLNEATADLNIKLARNNYYDYRNNLNDGYNSNIVTASQNLASAQSQMDTAFRKFVDATESYQLSASLNAAGKNINKINAQNKIDSAYQSVRIAQDSLAAADHAKRNGETVTKDKELLELDYDTAEHRLEQAWLDYNNAVAAQKATEINEGVALDDKFTAVLDAQTTYLNSIDAFNAAQSAYEIALRGADSQLSTYRIQYDQAINNGNASLNELKLAELYEKLDDCTIRASMDGVITELPKKKGDTTELIEPVATITSFDKMKVAIKINEYNMMGTSEGEQVTVTLNAIEKDYEGTISKISRNAESKNGVSYFSSEVDFLADEDVRVGMSVEIKLITKEVKGVPSVKTDSIQTRDDGSTYVNVYGEDGKTIEERDVEIGISDEMYTEIVSGLSEGDTILVTPLSGLDMGMEIG